MTGDRHYQNLKKSRCIGKARESSNAGTLQETATVKGHGEVLRMNATTLAAGGV